MSVEIRLEPTINEQSTHEIYIDGMLWGVLAQHEPFGGVRIITVELAPPSDYADFGFEVKVRAAPHGDLLAAVSPVILCYMKGFGEGAKLALKEGREAVAELVPGFDK